MKGNKIAKEDHVPPSAHPRPVTELSLPKDGSRAEVSDNDLIAAIAGGDRHAFTVLMQRHLSKMVTLAQRIVFDAEQAREIAQEAFLRVWTNAAKWDPDGSAMFTTWLRRVIVNLSIDRKRRRREQVDIELAANVPDTAIDGFGQVVVSHRKRAVRDALAQLPERQRAALALFYFEDISQNEGAEALQMTPKAFDSLLVRARRNMKKLLSAQGFLSKEDLP